MYQKVEVIYQDPLRLFPTLKMGRFQMHFFVHFAQNIVTQCLGMSIGSGGTEDKSVEQRLPRTISETYFNYVPTLDFLQRINDHLLQCRRIVFFNFLFFNHLLFNRHKNKFLQKYPFFQPFSCYLCKVFYAIQS